MTTIVFNDVVKTIKGTVVIDHVSMTLTSGHVYGFKGVNGSGKTMLMRLCAGLIYPSEGEVSVDGKRLGKDISFPPSMGLLIENPAFLGKYTGLENLKLINSIKKWATLDDMREAMELVGLEPDDKRKYRKYSLGMKQRLGIAAAFFEHPELIILDEPTNALDIDGIKQISSVIQKQRRDDVIILLACHDDKILNELSDIIFCVENGRIVKCLGESFLCEEKF